MSTPSPRHWCKNTLGVSLMSIIGRAIRYNKHSCSICPYRVPPRYEVETTSSGQNRVALKAKSPQADEIHECQYQPHSSTLLATRPPICDSMLEPLNLSPPPVSSTPALCPNTTATHQSAVTIPKANPKPQRAESPPCVCVCVCVSSPLPWTKPERRIPPRRIPPGKASAPPGAVMASGRNTTVRG